MTELAGLAKHIRTKLYDEWRADRKTLLETKWQDNIDAFNSISTGTWKKDEAKGWRSDTFVQITKTKVLSGYAMVIDMELQGGHIPFKLRPSPWDEVLLEELEDAEKDKITDSIEDMTGQIKQQLADCNADRALMKCVMSGAIYGEFWGKRFTKEVIRKGYREVSFAPQGLPDPEGKYSRWEKWEKAHDSPAIDYTSVWDIFRDLENDDLQECIGIIQRDMVSPYSLRKGIGKPLFIDKAIESAISEADSGDHGTAQDVGTEKPGLREIKNRKNKIERLEFWGRAPMKQVLEFEADLEDSGKQADIDKAGEPEDDGNEIEIYLQMAGNEIIRYARNTGDRPWYRGMWEFKLDHIEGTGIADNLKDSQKVLNGMVRGFEDNVKLIANVMVAVKKRLLAKGALDNGVEPGKEIEIAEECDDARKAIQQIIIQDITGPLINGIPLFERYADEASQIPKILQGTVAEKFKPDTLGEMNMLQQNAGKYLGAVIKNIDEGLIEPMIQDFYEWNMADPEMKRGKGSYIAQAMGFHSFQERVQRIEKLTKSLQLILSSEELMKEAKLGEYLKLINTAFDLSPEDTLKSKEEKQAEAKQAMELRAQEEAKTRQLMKDQLDIKIAEKGAEAEMDLRENEQEHEQDMEMEELEHTHRLVENAQKAGQEFEKDANRGDSRFIGGLNSGGQSG
ncbi:MAG: hypothetical protein GY841_23595 [FCB group bacterium]|nr:hypothetical protein [FCB group bacterium]